MRILMLNYEYPPLGGGAGNACYYLLKEFAKKPNVVIDLVTSSAKKKFEVEKVSKNITIYKLKIRKKDIHYWKMSEIAEWTAKAYLFCKKLARKNKYDLCHCWFGWPSGMIGYRLRRKMPYIVALRGSDVPGYNVRLQKLDKMVFKPISKRVWGKANAVIANSEGLRELALKTLHRKIDVIPNGIDTNQFKPAKNKKISGKIKLISTGRLIERKGYKYLIKALEGLQGKFELTLIGEGDQEQELKEMAKRLKVKVNFKGAVKHDLIPRELQKADIFVLPSLNEGMSNSILEAMACGLPIITTDTGGSKELIKGNGVVVKKQLSIKIRNILLQYIANKRLIQKHSLNSAISSKEMGWSNICKKYYFAYGNLLNYNENKR